MKSRSWICGGLVACGVLNAMVGAQTVPDVREIMPSIFKIHAVHHRPDYQQPWQTGASSVGTGSAFLIGSGRLLTCGHVVADAISIEVQAHGASSRHAARVLYMGYDCDLAILELEDPGVVENLAPLTFDTQISELGDEVFAIGFPMGGNLLSLTRGIVSRMDHATYAFSGMDQRLVMQIDAAINPGNSGGPVVNRENRVVGVAFQGIVQGQGLGYAVPLPVIDHFLRGTEQALYRGYPDLGVLVFELRNPALRSALGVAEIVDHGVVVTGVDRHGAGAGHLHAGDVLLAVEGVPIFQDGTIRMDGSSHPFTEMVERKQWGETITFDLLRDGESRRQTFALKPPPHPFVFRRQYDRPPEYVIAGGLCFMPLTLNYMMTLGNVSPQATVPAFYFFQRARFDLEAGDRRQLIVLASILPHPVNTYAGRFQHKFLARVNDREIGCLSDLQLALEVPLDGYHILEFEAETLPLILDAEARSWADAEIQRNYGVPRLAFIRPDASTGAPATGEARPSKGIGNFDDDA